MTSMIKIAPSIISADFAKLGEEVQSISSAEYIHFDVMDGSFVPNMSLGFPLLQSLRKITDQVLDVHLMIVNPVRYAKRYAEAGADIVVFHVEADQPQDLFTAIDDVKAAGKKVGLSIKPKTPASVLIPYLPLIDVVLVMTVEPGFGGQKFMEDQVPKIAEVKKLIMDGGYVCDIEVDGGINPDTAKKVVAAGANVLVAGSDVFKQADRNARIAQLRGEA